MITLENVKNNKEVQALIEGTQKQLNVLGYTEHSTRHISIVSKRASDILETFGYSKDRIELAKIAGYLHDIGNCVNRVDHAQSGALLAYNILKDMGMNDKDRIEIMMAIGNHDEQTGTAVSDISAALIFYFGRNIYSYAFMSFMWFILIFLSGRIFRQAFSAIKSFKMLYIFIFVTMLFFGENGSFSIYFTKEAMYNALLSTYQFVLIVAYSCMLTLTTSPSEIAKTLYIFIKPFKIFKVNVENTGLSMLIAVRFIPLIFEEASKIITAQKLRGLWIDNKSFKYKIKFIFNMDSFIIPLFVRVFHYAEQLSITALYRNNIDNVLKFDKMNTRDVCFLACFIIFTGAFYAAAEYLL